jgi:hypothetical protein
MIAKFISKEILNATHFSTIFYCCYALAGDLARSSGKVRVIAFSKQITDWNCQPSEGSRASDLLSTLIRLAFWELIQSVRSCCGDPMSGIKREHPIAAGILKPMLLQRCLNPR